MLVYQTVHLHPHLPEVFTQNPTGHHATRPRSACCSGDSGPFAARGSRGRPRHGGPRLESLDLTKWKRLVHCDYDRGIYILKILEIMVAIDVIKII